MPKVFQLNYQDNFEIEKELLAAAGNTSQNNSNNNHQQQTDRGKLYNFLLLLNNHLSSLSKYISTHSF